jgi:hypothetical protein
MRKRKKEVNKDEHKLKRAKQKKTKKKKNLGEEGKKKNI